MSSLVELTSDAYLACLSHCLITEKEEVMGLLLGNVENSVTKIWSVIVLTRSDKRKDRVEISPEQLASASQQAEELGKQLDKHTRVVGWYHSHPHITVHPSHVDLNTQRSYQYLDPAFIGLIFSCFNSNDGTKEGRIQLIAFQTIQNEANFYQSQNRGDSENISSEIPITIVPGFPNGPNLLEQIVTLQDILLNEEKQAFVQSQEKNAINHPLLAFHSSAVYQKSLCRLLEYGWYPVHDLLKGLEEYNKFLIKKLLKEKEELERALQLRQQ